MAKVPKVVQFVLLIGIVLLLLFLIHTAVLGAMGLPKNENLIQLSYLLNGLLAIFIYAILFFLRNTLKNQIGFLFIAGSALKFIVFFIVFYPVYKEDGIIQRVEFFAFFIPYLCALFLETFYTFKLLKKLD